MDEIHPFLDKDFYFKTFEEKLTFAICTLNLLKSTAEKVNTGSWHSIMSTRRAPFQNAAL